MAKLILSAAIPLFLLLVALASAVATTATAPLPEAQGPVQYETASPPGDGLGTCRKVLSDGGAGWDCVTTVVQRITSEIDGSPAPTAQCCINVLVMDQELGYCWSYLTGGSDTDGPSKLVDLCINDVLQGN